MASLEGRAIVACDWPRTQQSASGRSSSIEATWRDCSATAPPFATGAHVGRAGRYLSRHCQRLLIACHRATLASCSLYAKPGGGPPWGRVQYRANEADQQAWDSATRPKPCLLATHNKLQRIVAGKLIQDWSPKQISGWLKTEYPEDESLQVSHETIYRSLFIQARGALKIELIQHLRSKRRIRRSRHCSAHGHSQGKIVDAISIRERPAEVEDRAVPGHWEGDLLRGAGNSHIATLVERHSRFCMLVKVPGKDTATVVAALSRHVGRLPATLRRSLTWDRGLEMAQHKSFTIATDVQVYFCDPQSPWQRGSNENTNGLLRQYLPRTADLSAYSQSDLDKSFSDGMSSACRFSATTIYENEIEFK